MALAIAHGFELHAVGVEEEHGVIVVVIFAGRIDNFGALLLEKGLQSVHVLTAPETEGVMVEADIALAVWVLPALRIGGGDPEQGLAVRPAHHALVLSLDVEAQEPHQRGVEGFRRLEVADAENEMIDTEDLHHFLISIRGMTLSSSWQGLSRPSTSHASILKSWMPGTRPGMTKPPRTDMRPR